MKTILYIGNNLNRKTANTSGIQTLGPLLEKEGIQVYYASSLNTKVLRLLDMLFTCIRLSKKVDMVLIDTYSTQNFYYAYAIGKLCGLLKLNYVPILHGGNLPSRLIGSPKLSQSLFGKALFNVAPSLYLKEAFENQGYTNIAHIPNAININKYPFKPKSYDTIKMLWVRSFSELYNPKMAIYVFSHIKKMYPRSKLCMVGPDADGTQTHVKELARDLDLKVEFTGKLSKEEWISLADDYNVFINTTNFDNTPFSIIEAMAIGLPIVSTNVGGLPFLISHNEDGLLVAPNDSKAMAKAVISMFEDQEKRKSIVSNARQKVETFHWEIVKNKWLQLLNIE